MILTQDEARKQAEILKGFSEGKSYQIPFRYDDNGNVIEYLPITDFKVNKNCPTINMTYLNNSLGVMNPNTVIEVEE